MRYNYNNSFYKLQSHPVRVPSIISICRQPKGQRDYRLE